MFFERKFETSSGRVGNQECGLRSLLDTQVEMLNGRLEIGDRKGRTVQADKRKRIEAI